MFLIPLLDTVILAVLHCVQKLDEKSTVTTPEIIRKVKPRFHRNPRRRGRKIARELNILRDRMQHILKNKLGLKPLKFQKVQKLSDGQKNVRLKRAKEVHRLHKNGQLPKLVFSKEKRFQIQ